MRIALHYGDYYYGLIGTHSSGSVDVIGTGIDKACKLEGEMKSWMRLNVPVRLGITRSAIVELVDRGALPEVPTSSSGRSEVFGDYYVVRIASDLIRFSDAVIRTDNDSVVAQVQPFLGGKRLLTVIDALTSHGMRTG